MKRKYYDGSDFRRALSIDELRGIARRRVPNFAFEYVEGGAENESSLRRNRSAFADLRLLPTTLVDSRARQQGTTLFGRPLASPLIVAPTGLNGIPFALSTVANVRLEELAGECDGRLWMQLYVLKEREIARRLVERAERAGYEALVFTTDANVFGLREWDRRNFRAPAKLNLRNLIDVACHPRWLCDVVVPHGLPRFANIVDFIPPEARGPRAGVHVVPSLFAADISWDDVAWPRKLLIKGIMSVADAQRAAEAGCDGIVVSNHGGRQLDSSLAPIEVLQDIVGAVGDRLAVIVDSGFRRGTDVVKAIALGANAVMVGHAGLYDLAAGGEAGARHAFAILMCEIDRVLGQLGCRSLAELGPHVLVRERAPLQMPVGW